MVLLSDMNTKIQNKNKRVLKDEEKLRLNIICECH